MAAAPAPSVATVALCHGRQGLLSAMALAVLVTILIVDLGGRELWTDEVYSLQAGLQPLQISAGDASHPPGYYTLLHYWLKLGQSDGWLRAFSVFWGVLAWLLCGLLARELGLGREGLVAQWLMALSPLVALYFRLGRYYSLATAAAMLAFYLLVRLTRRPTWGGAVALAVSLTAVAYVDYVALGVVLLAVLGVLAGRVWRRDWTALRPLAGACVVALVLSLPIGLRLLRDTGTVAAIAADPLAKSLWGLGLKLSFVAYALATGECIDPWRWWVSLPAVALTVGLLLAGMVSLWRLGPLPRLVALLFPVNVIVAAAAMSTVAANIPPNRIMSLSLPTLPLAFLALARGIRSLPGRWSMPAVLGLMALVDTYGLANYFTRQQLLNPGYAPPWRQVAALIQEREQPGDTIWLYDEGFPRYYEGRALVLTPGQMAQTLAHVGAGEYVAQGRVWLIARDRGAIGPLDQTQQARRQLLAAGWQEAVFSVLPRTAQERQMRSLVLRRQAADAYVKVYLLTPPPP